jgi:hypothetical protein
MFEGYFTADLGNGRVKTPERGQSGAAFLFLMAEGMLTIPLT